MSYRDVTLLGCSVFIFNLSSCCEALCHVLQGVQQHLNVELARRIYNPAHTVYTDWLCYVIWLRCVRAGIVNDIVQLTDILDHSRHCKWHPTHRRAWPLVNESFKTLLKFFSSNCYYFAPDGFLSFSSVCWLFLCALFFYNSPHKVVKYCQVGWMSKPQRVMNSLVNKNGT
jgi:hypothetical protein